MSTARTKEIEIGGFRVNITQPLVGRYLEILDAEKEADGDLGKMIVLALDTIEKAVNGDLQKIKVKDAWKISTKDALSAYSEIARFALEDVPKEEPGKAGSP
jgi:hypothetical protein